jgi:hypothetical protein
MARGWDHARAVGGCECQEGEQKSGHQLGRSDRSVDRIGSWNRRSVAAAFDRGEAEADGDDHQRSGELYDDGRVGRGAAVGRRGGDD